MGINFALILVVLTAVSGLVVLLNHFYFAANRPAGDKEPLLIEYSRSFFPVLLIVLLLRSFLVEPFRIPSGSLEPTLLIGDFILVNKYQYGLRLPVLDKKVLSLSEPKQGDIAVFRWPPQPSIDYIKRVIGVPGDRVQYQNKYLTINGKKLPTKSEGFVSQSDEYGHVYKVEKRSETINGITHSIYVRPSVPANDFDVIVPPGQYFMMGDNRDDSSDSRVWGFLPEKNLVGRAFAIWMSWNGDRDSIRWQRLGQSIH